MPHLGALISKLEEHDLLDNTIIFFFNDHGQKAKGTLYQDGVLSPSIVWKNGGFACGNESNVKIQNIDFAPTILEFAGAGNVSDKFDGDTDDPSPTNTDEYSSWPPYKEFIFCIKK